MAIMWQSDLLIALCAGHSVRVSFVTWPLPSTKNCCSTVRPVYSGDGYVHCDTCVFRKEKWLRCYSQSKTFVKTFPQCGFLT